MAKANKHFTENQQIKPHLYSQMIQGIGMFFKNGFINYSVLSDTMVRPIVIDTGKEIEIVGFKVIEFYL